MKKIFRNLLFPFMGIISLVWFLARVIPKPSRAAYPCMRVAAPMASSFVIYLLGLASSLFFLKKARKYFHETRYILFLVMLFFGISIFFFTSVHSDKKVYAFNRTSLEGPNQPMGTGKGIYPGRVVWIHDADATDATCANTTNDYWYMDSNTDQTVVSNMLSDGLQDMTGQTTDAAAWDAIFHYYNQNHGKGDVGYTAGEKIVIKINLNGTPGAGFPSDKNVNTSPQICYAILNQLVNVAGVTQADITIGDPAKNPNDATYNKIHNAFATVKVWGRGTSPVQPASKVLYRSDGGGSDYLPQAYLDAAYMINIPVLKKHHRAGISLTSKNHFGSVTPFAGSAFHLHYSLPMPDPTLGTETGWQSPNGDYGVYRCFVDIMGHKDLGGKTILYLIDGLWGSINWGHPPIKWSMAPFNNDWPNSLFLSQDPVAIESVGYDFLIYEFDDSHPTEGTLNPLDDTHGPFPQFAGTEDFLHQAADSLNWATGILYDPENDGTILPRSMGTHEHWNNATEKKYTRNLGGDTGIELFTGVIDAVDDDASAGQLVTDFTLYQNYPNPFNATTNIYYTLSKPAQVNLSLHNASGQLVRILVDGYQSAGSHLQKWDGLTASGASAASGIYFYKITVHNDNGSTAQVKKMILNK
jgi:hypothetical protein